MKPLMLGVRRIARIIRHAMATPDAARNIACAATMVRPNTRITWASPEERVELVCRHEDGMVVFRAMASTRWSPRALDIAVCYYGGSWWVRDRTGAARPDVCARCDDAFAIATVLTFAWLDMGTAQPPNRYLDVPVAYLDHSMGDYISILLFV